MSLWRTAFLSYYLDEVQYKPHHLPLVHSHQSFLGKRRRYEDTSRSGRGFPCTPFPKRSLDFALGRRGFSLLNPHAGLKQHFEVAHACRIGQHEYPLAQIIPPQERHLSAIGGTFCVRL